MAGSYSLVFRCWNSCHSRVSNQANDREWTENNLSVSVHFVLRLPCSILSAHQVLLGRRATPNSDNNLLQPKILLLKRPGLPPAPHYYTISRAMTVITSGGSDKNAVFIPRASVALIIFRQSLWNPQFCVNPRKARPRVGDQGVER